VSSWVPLVRGPPPCRLSANADRLVQLEAQAKDAEENAGESEVREAFAARAEHYTLIGDKVRVRAPAL
jgi:hypothetical protein